MFVRRIINYLMLDGKKTVGFFVALFLLTITLLNHEPVVGLLRTPSLGNVLSAGSDALQQDIAGAIRPYKENSIQLNLAFQFRLMNESANQNLFQTEYSNAGIRAEVTDGILAIIVSNVEDNQKPHILVFPTKISTGKWYQLSIQAIESGKILAKLSEYSQEKNIPPIIVKIDSAKFSIANLIVGNGFDGARKFQGDIKNVNITLNKVMTKPLATYLYFAIVGALLLLTIKFYMPNLINLKSSLNTIGNIRRIFQIQDLLLQFIQFFSIALVGVSCTFLVLRIYFTNKAGSITENLLKSYQPINFTPSFKKELIFFLVAELIFIFLYIFINYKKYLFKDANLKKKLKYIPFISLIYLFSVHLFNKSLISTALFCTAILLIILQTLIDSKLFIKTLMSIKSVLMFKFINFDKSLFFQPILKKLVFAFFVLLSVKLFYPMISAWYPVVLPNDYYESVTTWSTFGSKSKIESSAIDRCARNKNTSLTLSYDRKVCEEINALNPSESLMLLNAWQAENGRIFYHHSYVFTPAKHFLKHKNISSIPFVYGIGNTIFSAYLMNLNNPPQSISSYFNTIPIAAIIGIGCIALLCLYVSNSFLICFLALLLSLGCYYSISYTPVLLAASFNPARFIGISVQIFSIFYLARKENIFAVILLIMSALFSLFWNFEFGAIGFFGQLCMLFLSRAFKNSYQILIILILLLLLILSFKLLKPINIDITESINFGLYNIGVPIMSLDTIITTLLTIFTAQFILIFINQKQKPAIKFANFSSGIVLALLSVKYFYNPSPPHLYLILLFIAPLYVSMMPWRLNAIRKTIPAIEALLFSMIFACVVFFTYNASEKYSNESLDFHSKFTSSFNAQEWASFGEKIKFVTPENSIAERVKAINMVLGVDSKNVKLLLLSPFDHIISFYVNPKSYCGHFELMTNVLTRQDMNTIKKCIENTNDIKVVYDEALTTRCPLEFDGTVNSGCQRKLATKNNLVQIMNEIEPLLIKEITIGDLSFYKKK